MKRFKIQILIYLIPIVQPSDMRRTRLKEFNFNCKPIRALCSQPEERDLRRNFWAGAGAIEQM